MIPYPQRITRTATGRRYWDIPGDCLRAAVASLTAVTYDEVPHFSMYPSWWWDLMRTWARQRGADFACMRPAERNTRAFVVDDGRWSGLAIALGPSPRGPYCHAVIVDADLVLVHDPHPAGTGVTRVDEAIILVDAYDPPPELVLALPEPVTVAG